MVHGAFYDEIDHLISTTFPVGHDILLYNMTRDQYVSKHRNFKVNRDTNNNTLQDVEVLDWEKVEAIYLKSLR